MIIECPNCHTKFNVDDSLIPQEGRKVKCSKCGNIFIARLEKEEDIFILEEGEGKEEEKKETIEEKESPKVEEEKVEKELEKVSERYQKTPPPKKPPKKGSGQKTFYLITLAMLIFAIVFAGGYLYFKTKNNAPPFAFTNLKGNFYENKKSGTILVLQGEIINKRNIPYYRVKLKAEVYDNKGKIIRKGETYIGNIFSEQELLNLTPKDLNSLIYDQVVLKPKSKLPFMIVIYNPPKISYSFQVEVVDYKIFRKK